MRIKQILSRNRRDFLAVFECEHCQAQEKQSGYDDAFFHNTVIPAMECGVCGKAASGDYRPLSTKYPEGMQL